MNGQLDRRRGCSRALLVVEDGFLTQHVGVRRVIAHYWSRLESAGYEVDLAVAEDGELTAAGTQDLQQARSVMMSRSTGAESATWSSWMSEAPSEPDQDQVRREQQSLGWRGGTVDPAAYDVSILTNPWVCAGDVPPTDYTHGVVYDMVPNLVSAQALDLVEFFDVTGFAHEHHLGYEFYERHARTLTCISDCTRRDLLRFYLRDECHRAVVDIPFDIADGAARVPERRHRDTGAEARILLVNPLDHRKNLVGIRAALLSVARNRPLAVSVVGRERVGWSAAETFFGELTGAGISVEWFRGASDDRLDALYAGSDVLLFPSLYEGLGLPILEAQAHGLPVVSASTSSCGEVNLNPLLATDPADHAAIAAALERSLSTGREVLRGTELRAAQDAFIAERGRGLHWGAPALAGSPAVGRSREAATSLAGIHS